MTVYTVSLKFLMTRPPARLHLTVSAGKRGVLQRWGYSGRGGVVHGYKVALGLLDFLVQLQLFSSLIFSAHVGVPRTQKLSSVSPSLYTHPHPPENPVGLPQALCVNAGAGSNVAISNMPRKLLTQILRLTRC